MAKVIVKNRDAHFNYELKDVFECGIELLGWEVKSIRANKVSIQGAFVMIRNNEAFLHNMHVSLYMSVQGEETRTRKLLVNKSELKKMREFAQNKGNSLIATVLKWSKTGYVKIDIALARGKTKIDKRETIKKRDAARATKQIMGM